MPLADHRPEHPSAFDECLDIGRCGSLPHNHALARFAAAFDRLFDGPAVPAWKGASAQVGELCEHVPGTADPRIFIGPFHGPGREGVMAAFCQTLAGRPVLLAMVAFHGPRRSDAPHEAAARARAMRLARRRVFDL